MPFFHNKKVENSASAQLRHLLFNSRADGASEGTSLQILSFGAQRLSIILKIILTPQLKSLLNSLLIHCFLLARKDFSYKLYSPITLFNSSILRLSVPSHHPNVVKWHLLARYPKIRIYGHTLKLCIVPTRWQQTSVQLGCQRSFWRTACKLNEIGEFLWALDGIVKIY